MSLTVVLVKFLFRLQDFLDKLEIMFHVFLVSHGLFIAVNFGIFPSPTVYTEGDISSYFPHISSYSFIFSTYFFIFLHHSVQGQFKRGDLAFYEITPGGPELEMF